MDYYFLIITVIDSFVLGTMCILTKYCEALNKWQRRWFISSFILIFTISILEVVTVVVDHGPVSLRWINITANLLGFGFSPAVPIFIACALEKNRSNKYAVASEIVYLLFLAITFPLKIVFYVDQGNQYMRGGFFGIYLVACFSGVFYLFVVTLRFASKYQNKGKGCIYLIEIFLLAAMMVQVVLPDIHVAWLCVSFLAILFFVYCNGMWQQVDSLTKLLNQKSYLNITDPLTSDGTLIVFDVDDFKQINDNYGHLIGDQCLEVIADCIKKAYSRNGFCYRIGGDEFCALLDTNADKEGCYRKLIEDLADRRKTFPVLPYVSIGSASFTAGDHAEKVKETADKDLYRFKKGRKTDNIGMT